MPAKFLLERLQFKFTLDGDTTVIIAGSLEGALKAWREMSPSLTGFKLPDSIVIDEDLVFVANDFGEMEDDNAKKRRRSNRHQRSAGHADRR